jgi:Protein of unknown function (DUF1549)/Protein of unknown function (DUF1553)
VRPNATALLLTLALGAALAGVALASPSGAESAPFRRAVERVDGELAASWKKQDIEPSPPASDAEFLRRVTLDLIGRIPTAGEAQAFLADRSPSRRERLVDRLLLSTDYADYWADVYLDLLVGRDLRLKPRPADAREYLRSAFAANTPFDRMAEQIVTASGPVASNGAAAFLVAQRRKGGSIESVAGETARIFLGLQVQCARCHDHPYDKRYKKRSFADFTAFFGDLRIRRDRLNNRPGAFVIEDRPLQPGAAELPRFQKRLKKRPDLAYALAEPRYFFRTIEAREGETKRQRLSRAIRSSDLLGKAAVNRLWTHLFGQPIAGDSWDDLGAEHDESHPALLRILASDFVAGGYDHRRLLKQMVLSRAYGRSSRTADRSRVRDKAAGQPDAPDKAARAAERAFARAAVRPLSADQLYRSLLIASGLEPEGSTPRTDLTFDRDQAAATGFRAERRRVLALREFLYTFADDEERQGDAFTGSVSQALLLLNGAVANVGARARPDQSLGRILASSPDMGRRIERMFLAALARPPTPAERERHARYIQERSGARTAYEDVYFALVTSTEFITNH